MNELGKMPGSRTDERVPPVALLAVVVSSIILPALALGPIVEHLQLVVR